MHKTLAVSTGGRCEPYRKYLDGVGVVMIPWENFDGFARMSKVEGGPKTRKLLGKI